MKKLFSAVLLAILIACSSSNVYAQETKAPDFSYTQLDTNKPLALSDYKGKYVLIDFWASWCPPCHAAVPFLKDAYADYKSKGLEVLGVSIDKDQKAWEKTVKEKGLSWPQVRTDDQGKSVAQQYSFNSIPYFVLVNPEGNIVAKGFRANEIDGILKKFIK